MTEDETTIELPPVLHLPVVNRGQIHPHAGQQYWEFLLQVLKEVPLLYLLAVEDLQLFLSDEERAKFKASVDEIKGWLEKCSKDNDEATLKVYPYHSPFNAMWDLRKLLKKVAEGKAKRERRVAALEEIAPPVNDSKKHLNDQEREQFLDSIPGAIDAYLGRDKRVDSYSPRIWLLNRTAWDYAHWTSVIKERKEKEARRKQAEIEHEQYVDRLSAAVEKLKAELAKSKTPKFVYPADLGKYEPDGWCDLELPSKQRIQNWAEGKILERLPQILANLTRWELTWERRVLPNAAYEVVGGVPALTWYFETHILVTVTLEMKTGVIRKRRPGGYAVEVQAEGEKLGTVYVGPVKWLTPGSLTTPLPLLRLLGTGEPEAPGIQVTERSPPFMTFAIQGFEEEVELCDDFRKFIGDISKQKPLAEVLLDIGVIDADTAGLMKAKWDQPLPVSGKLDEAVGSDLQSVVTKLVELGWTEAEAKKAVETASFPKNATIEEMVNIILQKSY